MTYILSVIKNSNDKIIQHLENLIAVFKSNRNIYLFYDHYS